MLGHQLPEIYRRLLPQPLLQATVDETKATCNACNWKSYQPTLKCCTYEPFLPNFLVGALFESAATSPSALKAMRTKIEKRQFSLPIGMTASVKYQVTFNQREENDFGNRVDWLCPYYNREQNNCGIWKNRGAVCTTFFCQSSYGVMGSEFWNQMNDYLTYVEMAVMEEVLTQMNFSPRQISDCVEFLNRHEGSPSELRLEALTLSKSKKLWGEHFEDQEAFFKKAYHLAENLSPETFTEALGELGQEIQDSLMESLNELQYAERSP